MKKKSYPPIEESLRDIHECFDAQQIPDEPDSIRETLKEIPIGSGLPPEYYEKHWTP